MPRITGLPKLLLSLATLAVVLAIWVSPRERVIARGNALYLEDAEHPRPIASVDASLVERDGERRLEFAVSALGAGVDPYPGIEGVRGSNRRTADELDRLVRERALRVVTRIDGVSHEGTIERVDRGFVPARRWSADGGIEPAPQTGAAVVVAVAFRSVALPDGDSETFVEVSGMPRLLVAVQGSALRIESLEELGR